MKAGALVLALLSSTLYAAEPTPTPAPIRGLLGRSSTPVPAARSLADVARQKPTTRGHVSQVDSSIVQTNQAPVGGSEPAKASSPGGPSVLTVNATGSQGTTHAAPIVGVSVEAQREMGNTGTKKQ